MGNQSSSSLSSISRENETRHPSGQPLESFQKEVQRNEHLRNLGFKRSKSLRKSISKRINKLKKNKVPTEEIQSCQSEDETSKFPKKNVIDEVVDGFKSDKSSGSELPLNSVKRKKVPEIGEIQPLPSHVQNLDDGGLKMDRLRKSLRSSLRRTKNKDSCTKEANTGSSSTKPPAWQQDEAAVRAGTCSFHVKYLGCVEVFESRGMQVCEEAVKVLKNSKRKSVRSIFYIRGDGLRVVDDITKGLLVDQTIEKVSFCAPDRNYERGFSYICRDGTTRRWMCHTFMAIKESGERLSHAVGCAFAVCLERKQKRDKECNVSMTFDSANASFTRLGSFRQPSLTERLGDPQLAKGNPPLAQPIRFESNPHAIARPHATDLMLARQTSFRGFNQLAGNSPFKRQLSLRLGELPSTLERKSTSSFLDSISSAIDFKKHLNTSGTNGYKRVITSSSSIEGSSIIEEEPPSPSQSVTCQQVSMALSQRTDEKVPVISNPTSNLLLPSSPLPTVPENEIQTQTNPSSPTTYMTHDNPWDFVPDQPKSSNNIAIISSLLTSNSHNTDSSSGISSMASQSVDDNWSGGDSFTYNQMKNEPKDSTHLWSKKSILDDPFDVEWATLPETGKMTPTNPFKSNSIQTAFELQM